MDPLDFIRQVLDNKGSNKGLADYLFAPASNMTKVGASYAVEGGCVMRGKTEYSEAVECDVVLVVIAAAGYRNKRSTEPC